MNLSLVHKLLLATTQQRHEFLKLANPWADGDVREMARVGLVEATLSDGQPGSFTSINKVTVVGHAFLQAFEGHTFPSISNSRLEKGTYWQALPA